MKFNPYMKLCIHENLPKFLKGDVVYPINIEISPVGYCNAKCDWCFYKGNYDKEILDYDVLVGFLSECAKKGVKAISWSGGGEPSLHPKFDELVDYVHSIGIKQGMFSNAIGNINYDPSKFEWIRVSKTDKPFNRTNLSILRSCKSVGLNINYLGDEAVVIDALAIADDIGLDYVQCRPALNLGGDKTECPIPDIKHPKLLITEYKFNEASQDRDYDKCYGYHFVPFIWHNGDYSICAYHKGDKDFVIGNIYHDSIQELVSTSKEFVTVLPSCQTCCKNHEINKLVNDLKKIEDICFV